MYGNTTAHTVVPNVTEPLEHVVSDEDLASFWIGFTLAVVSNVFIGSSFIFKKLGLVKIAKKQGNRAGNISVLTYSIVHMSNFLHPCIDVFCSSAISIDCFPHISHD